MKITGVDLVSKKLQGTSAKINSAASNAINRAATQGRTDGVNAIVDKYTLDKNYVSARIAVVSRASPTNLNAVIQSATRATLLDRFQSATVSGGVKVRVRRSGGNKTINGAFRVKNLKGSLTTGIAMTNANAARYYADVGLSVLAAKVKSKPEKGIHVLHSMSINQIFNTIRLDIEPNLRGFLQRTFMENLNK